MNVLIIGGGISGLTLAYKCIKQGYNVIIFEKSDRLGGKINSIYHSKTNINKVSITHYHLINLLNELNILLSNDDSEYLNLEKGFQEIIEKLKNAIFYSGKAKIMMESQVSGFINKNSYIQIKIKSKNAIHIYKGDILVSTVPKHDLLKLNKWNRNELSLINSVDLISLHHINKNFDIRLNRNSSFNLIPIHGLSMVNYNNKNNYLNKNDKDLRKYILKSSQVVFPDIQKIKKPKWVGVYNWNQGINIWKNDTSCKKKEELQQIFGKDSSFFIIGDTYNNNQGWIEGTLESIEDIFPKINDILNKKSI